MTASSSATSFRARRARCARSSRAHASIWSRAGTAAGCSSVGGRRDRGRRRSSGAARGDGLHAMVFAEVSGCVHGDRDNAAVAAAASRATRLAPLRRWPDRGRPTPADARRADGLSPPHGHGDRDRGRDRPADGDDRAGGRACCSTPATSPMPAAIRSRRRGGTVRASCMSTARTSAATCWPRRSGRILSFLNAVLAGVFTVPGDGCVDYPARARRPGNRRLSRLAGGRGRTGSGQGAPADLCAHGACLSAAAGEENRAVGRCRLTSAQPVGYRVAIVLEFQGDRPIMASVTVL